MMPLPVERDRKSHSRRTKQKVHELRPVKIGRVVCAGRCEHPDNHQNRKQDRVEQCLAPGTLEEPVRGLKGTKRQSQMEQRRGVQIDPCFGEIIHL